MLQQCEHTRSNGKLCKCTGFVERDDGGKKCKACKHKKSKHQATPSEGRAEEASKAARTSSHTPSVDEIVAKYRKGLKVEPAEPSLDIAREETNRGFRPKPNPSAVKLSTSGKQPTSKTTGPKAKSQGSKNQEKEYLFGTLVLLPDGIDSKGNLIKTSTPRGDYLEHLRKAGLAVDKDSDGRPLQFRTSWDAPRINRWIKGLLPAPFTFLDSRYPLKKGEYHWMLAKSHYSKLHLIGGDDLTGNELLRARGPASKAFHTYTLYFVSKYAIPPRVYKDWDRAMLQGNDSDDRLDESDPDGDECTFKRSTKSEESTSENEDGDWESDDSVEVVGPVRASRRSKGKGSAVNLFEDSAHELDTLGEDLSADGPVLGEDEIKDLEEKYKDDILEGDLPSLKTLLQQPNERVNAEDGPSRKRAASASHSERQEDSEGNGGERKKARGWFSQYSWGTPPSSDLSYNPRQSPKLPQLASAGSQSLSNKRPELPEIDFDPWA